MLDNIIEKEERFLQLCSNLQIKHDINKYPNSIFWFNKDGEYVFELDLQQALLSPKQIIIQWRFNKEKIYAKNIALWCSKKYVFDIFLNEYNMEFGEIRKLINGMSYKIFKLENCNVWRVDVKKSLQIKLKNDFNL